MLRAKLASLTKKNSFLEVFILSTSNKPPGVSGNFLSPKRVSHDTQNFTHAVRRFRRQQLTSAAREEKDPRTWCGEIILVC